MTPSEHILQQLQADLGFAVRLVGGAKAVLAQIDRFLETHAVAAAGDLAADPVLWNRLVAEVIVPETSFFRYPESFAALREWAAPRTRRPAQILCLPCSTGEETWSIAITLAETGTTNFHVDALDVSSRSIVHAGRGTYAEHSARGLPAIQKERWFERSGGAISVVPALRSFVGFRVANAFSLDAEPRSYDVIFCRNLLIYFDAQNQRRLFERLAGWLRPDGILFLGPGEATVASAHGWRSTGLPMSFSFVRAATSAPAKKATAPTPAIRPRPTPEVARVPPVEKPSEPDWMDRAAALADAGKLAEAGDALEKFHDRHRGTATSFLLRGILDEAGGRRAEAESHYRKALYLEPNHVDALMHLSLLLENDGRHSAARPFRRRLDRLAPTP